MKGLTVIAVRNMRTHDDTFSHVKREAFSRQLKAPAPLLDPDELVITKSVGAVNGHLLDALPECGQYKGKGNVTVFMNFWKVGVILSWFST